MKKTVLFLITVAFNLSLAPDAYRFARRRGLSRFKSLRVMAFAVANMLRLAMERAR